ncbi:MAG: hypothetical protein JO250_11790 [Armatimonadetes bacterium]|nr:hypothetical protein [Armatimonadota bacterium]
MHTVADYYDGPREGIANFGGAPHAYRCVFDEAANDWSDVFLLHPVDDETLQLALEDWRIWRRWEREFHEGRVTVHSHSALPEDRRRHEQLTRILEARLRFSPVGALQAKADFRGAVSSPDTPGIMRPLLVRWTVIKQADSDEATRRESIYEDHN